jgi:hypothetical protein
MNNGTLRIGLVITFVILLSSCGGVATPTREPTAVPPTATATEVVEQTEAATEPAIEGGATEALGAATEVIETTEALPEGITATTNFPNANARSGPGTEYEALGPLAVGTTLPVIARTEGSDVWYLVTLENGEPGWLWGRVVDLNPPDAEVEVAATIPPTPES